MFESKIKEAFSKTSSGIVLIPNPKTGENEEWIWVEGYKGTDKNMTCRDITYELGKQYDMPDDVEIEECENGYHLCMTLKDVFGYYKIDDGNRFFKVRALVRKHLVDNYGKHIYEQRSYEDLPSYYKMFGYAKRFKRDEDGNYLIPVEVNKLAAKSIEFIRELTIDEILADTEAAELPDNYKKAAIEAGVDKAVKAFKNEGRVKTLIGLGYCEAFANYVTNDIEEYDIAYAVGMQKDLSMDMKVFTIMK